MKQCSKCRKRAITLIRHNGTHLCHDHFNDFFIKRVRKELRREIELPKKASVVIAVSGGKDSNVALHTMHSILSKRRETKLTALTIDEGISGYRPPSLNAAKKVSSGLGIEHHTVSFKDELSFSMDDIAKMPRADTTCTYCGVFRRRLMNGFARDIGADALATGLNLDDTAQTILMNITRGDMDRLTRMGPHTSKQEGLIPRLQPLRTIPESEVFLYALVNDIPFESSECPYSSEAMRNRYKTVITGLEDKTPGTKHSILRSHEIIQESMKEKFPAQILASCKKCGEPSISGKCRSCELLATLS